MRQIGWDIFLGSKWLDRVFFDADMDADRVRHSLVHHDFYPLGIVVRRG